MLKRRVFLLLIFTLLFTCRGAEAQAGDIEPLVKRLMSSIDCTCGCGMTLEVCEREDPTCTTRPQIISRIERLAQEGMKEEEIVKGLEVGITPAEKAIDKAKRENKFLFLLFYEKGSDDSDRMLEVIKKAEKKWEDKANFFNVDINDKEEKDVLQRFGIYQAPVTLVMAPNGVIIGGLPGVVGLEELGKAFVSPKMAQIVQALQQRKVTFLCIQNDETKYAKEVQKVVDEVAEVLGKSVKVVRVDPVDKKEEELLRQIRVEPNITEAITIVIAQTGLVGDRFVGKITNRELFAAFQKVLVSRSGCGGMGSGSGGGTCE